jgi:large subunit ribosomal protein L25
MSNMSAVLEVKRRNDLRKSTLNKLRREGNIPAVIYGKGLENQAVYVSRTDLLKTIKEVGRNGIITLNIDDREQSAVLHDYQEDTLTGEMIHADFFAVDPSTEISAEVVVELKGEAPGVKDGGVLQQPLFELTVKGKVTDIPDAIQVDVSQLQVGDTITVGDIKEHYPFEIQHGDEETIVSILAPRQEEEISTGEQQEPGIPENEEGRETPASKESEG